METDTILNQAGLAVLLLEGVKMLYRKIIKNPEYNFPEKFYFVALPVMEIFAAVILAFLGVSGYSYPTDWIAWVKNIVLVLIAALASTFMYNAGLKPFKAYSKVIADNLLVGVKSKTKK